MAVLTVTMDRFENEVLKGDKPALLDFWAVWCGPCQMMSPIVDEFAAENPQFLVGKVNVDEQPELAAAFGIESIPTLVAIKDGRIVGKAVGVQSKERLAALFAD